MQQKQQMPQSSIMLLMVIMAVVMGLGGFLGISYLFSRPAAPEGFFPVTVDGVEVLVQLNADKTVELVGVGEAPVVAPVEVQPQAEQQPIEPTLPPPTETPLPPLPTAVPDKIIFQDYVVQVGDSLYSISARIDTSIALMSLYGISADSLTPGSVIRLPLGNPAYCPGRRPYAVGEGDTSFNLGHRFGLTPNELRAINGLDENYVIRVADILCVP